MIDHRNALNLLAVQIVQLKIVRQKAANMCLKASEKTSADPSLPPGSNRQKHCAAPQRNGPVITAVGCQWRENLWNCKYFQLWRMRAPCGAHCCPRKFAAWETDWVWIGNFARKQTQARCESKKAGIDVIVRPNVRQSMSDEQPCRSKHMVGTHWKWSWSA